MSSSSASKREPKTRELGARAQRGSVLVVVGHLCSFHPPELTPHSRRDAPAGLTQLPAQSLDAQLEPSVRSRCGSAQPHADHHGVHWIDCALRSVPSDATSARERISAPFATPFAATARMLGYAARGTAAGGRLARQQARRVLLEPSRRRRAVSGRAATQERAREAVRQEPTLPLARQQEPLRAGCTVHVQGRFSSPSAQVQIVDGITLRRSSSRGVRSPPFFGSRCSSSQTA